MKCKEIEQKKGPGKSTRERFSHKEPPIPTLRNPVKTVGRSHKVYIHKRLGAQNKKK